MSSDAATRLLTLKAKRGQVQERLDEWESTFKRIHGRDPTAADRHRSSQHRELSRLLVDVDGFVKSIEGGSTAPAGPSGHGTLEAERRANRGRIKARMRRWDREFERTHNRKPTDKDHQSSQEFMHFQQRLQEEQEASERGTVADDASARAPSSSPAPPAQTADEGAPSMIAPPPCSSAGDGVWSSGDDYHELLRARVKSQAAVNGFEGVSLSEVHAAAAMFSHWDLDRDGLLGGEEYALVVNSLAQHTGKSVDADTVRRLLAIVDRTGSGSIDFNEWLAVYKMMVQTGRT